MCPESFFFKKKQVPCPEAQKWFDFFYQGNASKNQLKTVGTINEYYSTFFTELNVGQLSTKLLPMTPYMTTFRIAAIPYGGASPTGQSFCFD